MVNAPDSSAAILALLEDDSDRTIQSYALQRLHDNVHLHWAEMSNDITRIEELYEDESFPDRQLAALVASKVYYHLGALDEALTFALGAGNLFNVDDVQDQYVETIIAQCIDNYIEQQSDEAAAENPSSSKTAAPAQADDRLRKIVERMLNKCLADKEYKQALGLALEARRFDMLQQVFDASGNSASLLSYTLDTINTVALKLSLRNQVLRLLVDRFKAAQPQPDYFAMLQCFVYLNDTASAADVLKHLLKPSATEENTLLAYQIAFDLADTATQEFLQSLRAALDPDAEGGNADSNMDGAADSSDSPLQRVRHILTREVSIQFYVEFLNRNNHADLLILKKTKDAMEGRSSIYHSAVSFANAFAHAGTLSDQFLRENLDWLGKAANWSKFTATAALGVIHKGNLTGAMDVVQPYLPPTDGRPSTSPFSEGGSLYALGLIHANHGSPAVLDYLRKALGDNQNDAILHGAALGLGIAGMATGNEELYDDLKNVLYNDNAIAGEAAGYAMGLVMLGTASPKAVDEMLQYAHETQHEKIIRGLALGLAFLCYGKQEEAEDLIETLCADKDAIIRYGGIYAVALAYTGTGNNKAIRRLLHVAVSDVDDDVRRAAVTALGFILFRQPTQVPRIVQLLSESYNPHVRCGATLALGLSCAGTGLQDAIDLLEPLMKDSVDFVRQGACVSLAMVLIQQNATYNPKVTEVREKYEKIISDKHEDPTAKLGATVAQGLIDAGGRNVTMSLQTKSGTANMPAIVGMTLFTQFWFWFPLAHAASLAFTPTAFIGVDSQLKIPKFDFVSNVKPSLFAYPPPTKLPEKQQVEKVQTAVLSTTAKSTARAKEKEKEKNADSGMQTDDAEKAGESKKQEDGMQVDEKDQDADGKPASKRKDETNSELLPNLSRVVPAQLAHISLPDDCRFAPVRAVGSSGSTSSTRASRAAKAKAGTAIGSGSAAAAVLASSSTGPASVGGGIVILRDKLQGKEPVEYVELQARDSTSAPTAGPDAAAASSSGGASGSSDPLAVDMSAPIADAPAPFDYDFRD